MDPAHHHAGLSSDDALSLWVGRVARTHALLEYDVDNVYRFLVRRAGRVVATKSMVGFEQLVSECRKLLGETDLGPELVRAGDVALRAAKDATRLRNRVVHDMWLPGSGDGDVEPPRWNTFQRSGDMAESYGSALPRDLTTVTDAHALLVRTRMRVSGLFMALHSTWPADPMQVSDRSDEEAMARYFALMTDRFTLHANGDFDVR